MWSELEKSGKIKLEKSGVAGEGILPRNSKAIGRIKALILILMRNH